MAKRPISKADRHRITQALDALPDLVQERPKAPLDSHVSFAAQQTDRRSHSSGLIMGGIAMLVGIVGMLMINFSTLVYDLVHQPQSSSLIQQFRSDIDDSFAYEPPYFAELQARIAQANAIPSTTTPSSSFSSAFVVAAMAAQTSSVVQSADETIEVPFVSSTTPVTNTELVF